MSEPLEAMLGKYAASLIERLNKARKAADRCEHPFERGRHFGYYMALVMLLNRAKAAGIDLQAAGLDEIDPEDFM